ncbi:hypothetical protein CDN99_04105 [Roseateles aquatilis]|uniref:Uncharacterized protein n=1 Tax=Roseateles aquatilis TaxID=431061 RepID=A0A246JLX3_9BURK|nr:hypothetical protein CDN99_04105 [Roseateles aquatilis]
MDIVPLSHPAAAASALLRYFCPRSVTVLLPGAALITNRFIVLFLVRYSFVSARERIDKV